MHKINTFNTSQKTAKALANHLKQQVEQANGPFYLAISGGSTPKMLFEALVEIKDEINWAKIQLFWVDERCVSPTDDDSNYKMTQNALLEHIALPTENVHRMKGELKPKEGLLDYQKEIDKIPAKNGFPEFDLIILGMGDDGHTASIFPTEKELLDKEDVLAIGTNPYSGQKRLTLTGKTINNAKEVIFHVTGKNKATVLTKILNQKGDFLEYPAAHINGANTAWFVDKAALGE
jgi:6-phosphogluconolactonase